MRIDPKRQARRVRGLDPGQWQGLPPLPTRRGNIGRLLGTRSSLTAALRQHGTTTVTILRQRLARANRDETRLLGQRGHGVLMVREVLLRVDGQPWVFAHTLANLPARRLLRRAGRRPLATVLFTDPMVSAGGLHYRSLPVEHALSRRAQAALNALPDNATVASPVSRFPARRAVFVRGQARLCVTEVFLPCAVTSRRPSR